MYVMRRVYITSGPDFDRRPQILFELLHLLFDNPNLGRCIGSIAI